MPGSSKNALAPGEKPSPSEEDESLGRRTLRLEGGRLCDMTAALPQYQRQEASTE